MMQNNIRGGGRKIPPTHTIFFDNNKEKNAHVGGVFGTPPEHMTIEEGLDFILEHLSQPWFPRKVSTAATRRGQHAVDGKDRAILYCQGALKEDFRVAAFGI